MEHILVVDGNNLCWTSGWVFRHLMFKGRPTGVVYGFFRTLLGMYQKLPQNPVAIAFCWDSRKLKRTELYPEYKSNRKPLTEEELQMKKFMSVQIETLRDCILPELGFRNNFLVEGYESDDIIANIVRKYKKQYFIHILSSDNDLYQLLSDNVVIHSPNTRKKEVIRYTAVQFTQDYGISPHLWAEVKAIAGCSTDNVKGVPRVGEKTAIKYLRGELKGTLAQRIEEHKELIERNRKLVYLPFEPFDITLLKHTVSYSRYYNLLQECGFKSLMNTEMLFKAEELFHLK